MYKPLNFFITAEDSFARTAILTIGQKQVETPVFMPVGTNATVKAVKPDDLSALGFGLILANAYHLYLKPSDSLIKELGGLHRFMNWPGLILTDSGGFQAHSLSQFNKLTAEGFKFKSHLDGSSHFLSPKKAIEIQLNLNSDIAMCLDYCPSDPTNKELCQKAVSITSSWAKDSFLIAEGKINIFGIIQGGIFEDLRKQSAEDLKKINFNGYAIGGVSVGEKREYAIETLKMAPKFLPADKPRYAMGIGDPESILESVASGVDMFDCVLPTRIARNGALFTKKGLISIKQAKYATDNSPIEQDCNCYVCKNYSKAYLRHLYSSGEILSAILNSHHNLAFLADLMAAIRKAIKEKLFTKYKDDFLTGYKLK